MLIADYLSQFLSTGLFGSPWTDPEAKKQFELAFLCPKLKFDLQQVEKQGQGWRLIVGFIRRAAGASPDDTSADIHPDDVLTVAKWFKVTTLEEFANLAQACNFIDANGLLQGISSDFVIDYDKLQTVSYEYMTSIFKRDLPLEKDIEFQQLDSEYKMLDWPTLELILKKCPSKKLQWRAERSDCDDIARVFTAWLSQLGYGNLTLGYYEINLYDDKGNSTGAHAIVAGVVEGKAFLVEPQSNQVVPANYVIGVGSTNSKGRFFMA